MGWNVATGTEVHQPDLPGLRDITMTPMKYGFHGTLKPPFRLAEGTTAAQLNEAAADVAKSLPAARCGGLALTALGRFLALTPTGDVSGLQRIAETCVTTLDPFRAPAAQPELARRRNAGLSARQEALLTKWGYPYVMEEFRFHLTLSSRIEENEITYWSDVAKIHLPDLPSSFDVNEVALCGEREDGRFELIHRYTLTG